MAHLEIEIKSLLGTKAAAETLKTEMSKLDAACTLTSTNTQLNHYFEGGDIAALYKVTQQFFESNEREKFEKIIELGTDFSVRTRQRDSEVLLVIKASVDAGSSANTVSRLEFEEAVPVSLSELDELLLASGYTYQAKWSREREEYSYKGIVVCIDKNAGYGYLAEFEKIAPEGSDFSLIRSELEAIMAELHVDELDQARLARMFAHYNANWAEYYGTDQTFIIA